MRVECPYCAAEVDVTSLANHVESEEGNGHGPQGTLPFDAVDNPWNLRVDVSRADAHEASDDTVPPVDVVEAELRRGRCPNCDRGVMALKGGDGFLSRGRRRLACPNCRWESPEWVRVEQ